MLWSKCLRKLKMRDDDYGACIERSPNHPDVERGKQDGAMPVKIVGHSLEYPSFP